MKKLILFFTAFGLIWSAGAADTEWLTVLSNPLAKARAEKKPILLEFTGSDWCGWCKKFDREVLSTPEFTKYARTNLVLVKLDFPHKVVQADTLKNANSVWKKKYKANGYPTFVLIDANGKELGRQRGYAKGGPSVFINKLEKFRTAAR